jgi:hypothetical protein
MTGTSTWTGRAPDLLPATWDPRPFTAGSRFPVAVLRPA